MAVWLRRFCEGDVPYIVQYMNEPHIREYLADYIPLPYTQEHGKTFVAESAKEFPLSCAVVADGAFAGSIGLREKGDIYRCNLEIGYWIAHAYCGQGVATEAVRQMVKVAFREAGISRVFANVFAPNLASCHVLEKAGFAREGYHKQALIKRGMLYDSVVYAVCREDWLAKQEQ